MSYSVKFIDIDNVPVYGTEDGKRSCVGHDKEFQQWLRDNQNNLPADIQAKVDEGTLTIQEAE